MKIIDEYTFFWRHTDNAGSLHLHFEDDSSADLSLNSLEEANFLLDLLRTEKRCFYDDQHQLIGAGQGHFKKEKNKKSK